MSKRKQKGGKKSGKNSSRSKSPGKQSILKNNNSTITILHSSGLLDSYEYFLRELCKKGLPSGNIFDYAAIQVLTYEKKLKAKKMKKEQTQRQKNWLAEQYKKQSQIDKRNEKLRKEQEARKQKEIDEIENQYFKNKGKKRRGKGDSDSDDSPRRKRKGRK